jgi:hypothetical protein
LARLVITDLGTVPLTGADEREQRLMDATLARVHTALQGRWGSPAGYFARRIADNNDLTGISGPEENEKGTGGRPANPSRLPPTLIKASLQHRQARSRAA